MTNGGVRDLAEVEPLGFQYYAGSVMVSHAYVHMVDWGTPVTIGGLEVRTGDLIHADRHGVQVVPLDLVRAIPAAVEKIVAAEHRIISLCQSPEFTLDELKKIVP